MKWWRLMICGSAGRPSNGYHLGLARWHCRSVVYTYPILFNNGHFYELGNTTSFNLHGQAFCFLLSVLHAGGGRRAIEVESKTTQTRQTGSFCFDSSQTLASSLFEVFIRLLFTERMAVKRNPLSLALHGGQVHISETQLHQMILALRA